MRTLRRIADPNPAMAGRTSRFRLNDGLASAGSPPTPPGSSRDAASSACAARVRPGPRRGPRRTAAAPPPRRPVPGAARPRALARQPSAPRRRTGAGSAGEAESALLRDQRRGRAGQNEADAVHEVSLVVAAREVGDGRADARHDVALLERFVDQGE